MSSASLRRVVRLLHVAAACALGTYLYSPLIDATWAARVLQVGVFPAMAVSGLVIPAACEPDSRWHRQGFPYLVECDSLSLSM
jgi:hypothetical protein